MQTSKLKRFMSAFLTVAYITIILAIVALLFVWRYCKFEYQIFEQSETADELFNPYQGFYTIRGYRLSDDSDPTADIDSKLAEAPDECLVLMEINLRNYSDTIISDTGLMQLDTVLSKWSQSGKQIILRFLYDWDGNNLETEPESIEQIAAHMAQVAPIVNKYSDSIYILQGVFVGDFGEMHDSKFISPANFKYLAGQLARLTNQSIFLSVRTPSQWEDIVGYTPAEGSFPKFDGSLASRLGLFNDGMLGSSTDLGTYKGYDREDGIAFQNNICNYVPNGGEVVIDNEYNDFENAVKDLSRMHVSYLNSHYDRNVLNKWRNSTYHGDDCFDGVDGYTYIKEHLGYRYVIRSADVEFNTWLDNTAHFSCVLENVGFGSCLRSMTVSLLVEDNDNVFEIPIDTDIRELKSGECFTLTADLPVRDYGAGEYQIYLKIYDPITDTTIKLATDLEQSEKGVLLGGFSFSNLL